MYPPNGQQQPKWWQSLGQLGQSVGKIAGNQITKNRANNALQQDQPLHDSVNDIAGSSPMPTAGPAPAVGPYPGADTDAGDLGDDFGEPAADGKIVTKPTRVLLAEHGQPEAVVPLTPRPDAKVRPGMAMGRRYYGE